MPAANTNSYETTYILKPNLSEKEASVIHAKVDDVISKFEGKLYERDDWGVKDLAYPIDENRSGRYCVVNFVGRSGVVEEIERHFRISGDVLRYLTVNTEVDYDYKKFKKQVAAAEEEKKARKEKSFERKERY